MINSAAIHYIRRPIYPLVLLYNVHHPPNLTSLRTLLLALHTNIPLNPITHNNRRIPSRTRQIDILQRHVRAHRVRRTHQTAHDLARLAGRRARDILKPNVGDVHLGRKLGAFGRLDVEVALVEHDRVVRVLDVDVFVCDVRDAAVADLLAGPGFETGSIL